MEKLKCESCGANLEIDEDKEYATCPYCKLKYKLKKDTNLNLNLELDENTKNTIKKGGKLLIKFGIVQYIVTSIIAIVIIVFVIFTIFKIVSFTTSNKDNEIKQDIIEKDNSKYDEYKEEFNKTSLNVKYEMYSGKQSKFFLEQLFTMVINNNKKSSDKKIEIVYNETSAVNTDDINNLYDKLQEKEYNVELFYDDNGYVNKISIDD